MIFVVFERCEDLVCLTQVLAFVKFHTLLGSVLALNAAVGDRSVEHMEVLPPGAGGLP